MTTYKATKNGIYFIIAIVFWFTWAGLRLGQSNYFSVAIAIVVIPVITWLLIINFNQIKRNQLYVYMFIFVTLSALSIGLFSGHSWTIYVNFFISISLYILMHSSYFVGQCKKNYAALIALPILIDILYPAFTGEYYKLLLIGSSYSHISAVLIFLLTFIILFYENCKKDVNLTIVLVIMIITASMWSGSRSAYIVVAISILFILKVIFESNNKGWNYLLIVLSILIVYILMDGVFQQNENSTSHSFSLAKFNSSLGYLDGPRHAIAKDFFSRELSSILVPDRSYRPLGMANLSIHNSFVKVVAISGVIGILYLLMLFVRFVVLRKTMIFLALAAALSAMLYFNDIGLLNSRFDFLIYLVFLSPYYGVYKPKNNKRTM
jgi:hypothetical protein